MKLALNGRDAIPAAGSSGTTKIGLVACVFAKVQCTSCLGKLSGDYVDVVIADRESGVGSGILSAMFHLFITSKAPGARNGLGLLVADGLVHAVVGHIIVEHLHRLGTALRLVSKT